MTIRQANTQRITNETRISAEIRLDGLGKREISTGIGFFDHMLDHIAKHSGMSLTLKAEGDLHVDYHHTVEDAGIVLGELIRQAVGDARGITRYGFASVPMEEALAEAAIDLCGRGFLVYNAPVVQPKVGEFDSELAREFFLALSRSGNFTLHLNLRYGTNQHHILEGLFKAFARAFREAIAITGGDDIPSTKGVI